MPYFEYVVLAALALLVLALISSRSGARRRMEELERSLARAREDDAAANRERVAEAAGDADRGRKELLAELEALEGRLGERLDGLAGLAERLEELGTAVADLAEKLERGGGRENVAEKVGPLLREAVESLDGRLRHMETSIEHGRETDSEDTLRRVLAERGFTEVRIIEGPESEGGRLRLTVEARRDGMTYKGPVFLDGSKVVEQRLSPSYPMFP